MPSPGDLAEGAPRPQGVPGRTLADLAALLGVEPVAPGVVVTGATLDSRAVRPGDLYAALPGAHAHGADFAAQAAAGGAVAALTDPAGAARAGAAGLPALVVPDPRAVLGRLSARVYGDPAAHLLLLGVTGTNGKTTTAHLLEAALAGAGWRTGLVGTVGTRVAGRSLPSARTTPEAPELHALLALMRERGVRACAMEVSSHAVVQHRVDGLVLDVAAFTNLSQDHLDFHGTMDRYFAAKAELFTPDRARRGVVVVDDAWGARLAERARATGLPVTTVATSAAAPAGADWRVLPGSVRPRPDAQPGSAFALTGPDGEVAGLTSPLPGTFNVANTALAHAVLRAAGVGAREAAAGLAAAGGVPGRMEVVPGPGGGPRGVVDYAHTPDAVAAALAALRPSTAGPLVVVLGAGGDRDRGKRAGMGAAAARGADVVVVTDDNPRSEDPALVRAAVLAGAREHAGPGTAVLEVPDRARAVEAAVRAAVERRGPGGPGTVLVAGKGHEQGQEVAGRVLPFDDREVLRAALAAAGAAPAGARAGRGARP
ncbi:UDP-N-acetylmuramoyl-L-alanyl-D-glutamate--2,6-diaminopimelate ligase [Quadrisphaera sp. DSM 44207]|uniref:UDP-N-acetylmuramoyl-L-alanyl-D-glutamate--2, 6-diaminopimelate ligase n=1 Tax=Quadrisphaera sp. DSM 44207 TaxID=1881057 RepID=UPI000888331B|nr:UDP-N-acetylmuramoyl-L-alanyl-D-glutamate--2,6-diaminopimelate ligase [Quadrisphaera sp. DSM 44207]SDQ53703.1 UDP-N-acetylmuramoylalanyl-D-glutamate--2,6-diaminopimelate ligase [Quadrisphaera sp. DSM 44207]